MSARRGNVSVLPPGGVVREYVGPHFSKLNPRQQAFVRAYVVRGRRNAKQAYIDAGYQAANPNVAAVNACNMLHREDVQQAVRELCLKELVALAPMAVRVAADIMENAQTDPAVKARMALGVMDRTGLVAATEHKVTVEHIGDNPQAISQARAIIQRLGLTADQVEAMFGRTLGGKVVEAEYVEVVEDDEPEEELRL